MPAAEFYLECAAAASPENEPQLIEAISAALSQGTPWPRIAQILDTTTQAAKERYEPLLDALNSAIQ